MNVFVVLYDEPDEPGDVMAVFADREEAEDYVGDSDTLVVVGPFAVQYVVAE